VIGTRQYREMESSYASALPAREPKNIEAAGKARERETNFSDPLMAPEARKGQETNAPCPRETESMGARSGGQGAAAEGGGCRQTSGGCGGAAPFICRRGDQIRATIGNGP
jgi:hypothetical protein